MPPTLRKRKDIDYSEAPRSKRVKLDPLKAEPSKSERPDRSSRRQPRAPAVAPGLHPTAAPTRRKTQEKTDKLLHKPAEASNRGRKEKRGPEEDLLTERKPEAPSTPQPLTEENLHAFDSATKMPKVLTRQPTQNGTESQTATGTTRSRKLSQKKAAELLTKHRIYLERELPMPEGLTALVERIREGSYASRCARGRTPTSEEVARSMPWISKLQELAAQQHLQDALGYPGERELRKDKE